MHALQKEHIYKIKEGNENNQTWYKCTLKDNANQIWAHSRLKL
jgi:hypothetical protein